MSDLPLGFVSMAPGFWHGLGGDDPDTDTFTSAAYQSLASVAGLFVAPAAAPPLIALAAMGRRRLRP